MTEKLKHWFITYSETERGSSYKESQGIVRAENAWEAYGIAQKNAQQKGSWTVRDMKPLD